MQRQRNTSCTLTTLATKDSEFADGVAFAHVADGLPDAVGGSAGSGVREIWQCVPVDRVAAVDVVADEARNKSQKVLGTDSDQIYRRPKSN